MLKQLFRDPALPQNLRCKLDMAPEERARKRPSEALCSLSVPLELIDQPSRNTR